MRGIISEIDGLVVCVDECALIINRKERAVIMMTATDNPSNKKKRRRSSAGQASSCKIDVVTRDLAAPSAPGALSYYIYPLKSRGGGSNGFIVSAWGHQ